MMKNRLDRFIYVSSVNVSLDLQRPYEKTVGNCPHLESSENYIRNALSVISIITCHWYHSITVLLMHVGIESLHHNLLLPPWDSYRTHQQSLHCQVLCCVVGAIVQMFIPQKLNFLNRPANLMFTEEDSFTSGEFVKHVLCHKPPPLLSRSSIVEPMSANYSLFAIEWLSAKRG